MSASNVRDRAPAIFILFGIYVLAGALSGAMQGSWPIFMPPQLDLFGLLFGLFGKPLGAYIGAAFLAAIGAFCIWLGAMPLQRPRT